MIGDLIAAAGFLAFLAVLLLTWRLEHARAPDSRRRRAANAVIAIAVTLSFTAGLRPRELWPFATWWLMPSSTTADVRTLRVLAEDDHGDVHAIDNRAWSPLAAEELYAWLRGPFTVLGAAAQDSALAFLLQQAEAARRRVIAGASPSPHPSALGRLAASTHLLHPMIWNSPSEAPRRPFRALALVEERWNVVERRQDSARFTRTTLRRFPATP